MHINIRYDMEMVHIFSHTRTQKMSFNVNLAALTLITLLSNLGIMVKMGRCQVIQPGCQETCGNVSIPYPFGIGTNCALNKDFMINCNHTSNPPNLKPSLATGGLEVIDISYNGTLRKYTYVAHDCYNHKTRINSSKPSSHSGDFFFSPTLNKFTAVGCDTFAVFKGATRGNFVTGCLSLCLSQSAVINGSCSGIGCCQAPIPKGLSNFGMMLDSINNHSSVLDFNPCSYAFIADVGYFNFSGAYLQGMPNQVPTVLDWVIGKANCSEAQKNATTYACKEKCTECRDYDNGPGYRCFCNPGYEGNPYVPNGCVDIDECKEPSLNNCSHKCRNTNGSYTCSCPSWFHGDPKMGRGCKLDKHRIILVIIGDLILLGLIVIGSLVLQSYRRKTIQRKIKENLFKQNGGFILQDRISRNEVGSKKTITIFSSEELKEATDNFSEERICGRGGFGTVYKGCLSNGSIVAIKKSKMVDQGQVEQFIKEITVLSQIDHQNVVMFLGCCLETQVPLLVYEFITNGTLSDHIHNDNRPRLSWPTRLKIAAETAGVLKYLHTEHSPQIIHRDIKPSNILLDDDYTSKVSDFGASKLIPKTETEMCTMVQGTLGYLDPEYLQTSQLTEKSDVYSFGVVLIELITGLKAVSFDRPEEDRSLVFYFLSLTREDEMQGILDKTMINEDNIEKVKQVVKIAKKCVRVKAEERPTMKEVATELEGLLKELKNKWVTSDSIMEENENLLGEVYNNSCGSSIQMSEYSGSRQDFVPINIDGGR